MSKALIVGAVVAGAVVLAKRHALRSGGFDFERWIERMPDNAPPKWMFGNISAIRENTDRILELLESDKADTEKATRPRRRSSSASAGETA